MVAEHPSLLVKGRIETITRFVPETSRYPCGRATAQPHRSRGLDPPGTTVEPPLKRAAHALVWEMTELQIKIMLDDPEVWVPRLAVILEKYKGNQEATSAIFLRLVDLRIGSARGGPEPSGSSGPRHPELAILLEPVRSARDDIGGRIGRRRGAR